MNFVITLSYGFSIEISDWDGYMGEDHSILFTFTHTLEHRYLLILPPNMIKSVGKRRHSKLISYRKATQA